jgi:hypothetical protein
MQIKHQEKLTDVKNILIFYNILLNFSFFVVMMLLMKLIKKIRKKLKLLKNYLKKIKKKLLIFYLMKF